MISLSSGNDVYLYLKNMNQLWLIDWENKEIDLLAIAVYFLY